MKVNEKKLHRIAIQRHQLPRKCSPAPRESPRGTILRETEHRIIKYESIVPYQAEKEGRKERKVKEDKKGRMIRNKD